MHAGLEKRAQLGLDFFDGGEVAGGDELGAEFGERVGGEEGVGFAGQEVVAGVVGGVSAEAKCVGFYEDGARGGADLLQSGGGSNSPSRQ